MTPGSGAQQVREKAPEQPAIRPFQYHATRFPEREREHDQSQGVPLATMQAVAQYWEPTTTGDDARRG